MNVERQFQGNKGGKTQECCKSHKTGETYYGEESSDNVPEGWELLNVL